MAKSAVKRRPAAESWRASSNGILLLGEPALATVPLSFAVRIVLGICLAALLAHIALYNFQCDDAFISFRYARNLADGHGLVFNPGFERVEGYTNFLWVVLLAAGSILGLPPEQMASPVSIVLSLGLAVWLLLFCKRNRLREASLWWLVVPAAFLAANRSYAVWSTSGLETKLFELLTVGGVFLTLDEMKAMREGKGRPFPLSALFFALATLTRPDGLLISGCVVGTRIVFQLIDRSIRLRPLSVGSAVFVGLVGGHYLFRFAYYGDWLPNTYYAKVSGQTWWAMGGRYLACFALEYGMILWLPLLIAAGIGLYRVGRGDVLLVILAAIAPHALYIAAIGGDHFEYRPLDVYLPLLFVLLYFGAATMGVGRARVATTTAYLVLCLIGSLLIPVLTRIDYPSDYRSGFPAVTPREDSRTELIDSKAHPMLFRIPLLGGYLRHYNDLMRETSRQFVGLRQEEHELFLSTVTTQGRWLAELVASGMLPRDAHIAVSCVGAIPYYSGLRTLDRLGLTDYEVAHRPAREGKVRMMAHEKEANPVYAVERGVDLWAAETVHLILPMGHPLLYYHAYLSRAGQQSTLIADVGNGRFILAYAMQGVHLLLKRFPLLRFMPASEYLAIELAAHHRRFEPVPREAQLDVPYDNTYLVMGHRLLTKYGDVDGATQFFERALATNPENADAKRLLETIRRLKQPGG